MDFSFLKLETPIVASNFVSQTSKKKKKKKKKKSRLANGVNPDAKIHLDIHCIYRKCFGLQD